MSRYVRRCVVDQVKDSDLPPIEGLKVLAPNEVEEDSGDDGFEQVTPRSTALSRRTSDAQGSAANAVKLRRLSSLSTNLSRTVSRTVSGVESSGTLSRRESIVSPRPTDRLLIRSQIRQAEQEMMEQRIVEREQHAPEAVLVKRWLAAIVTGRSAVVFMGMAQGRQQWRDHNERARDVLGNRFLPMWRLDQRRRLLDAKRRIWSWFLRLRPRLRHQRNTRSAITIANFLKNKLRYIRHSFRVFRSNIVMLQRAVRKFFIRRELQVSANLVALRRFEAGRYWQ